jgi:hypothetical protein
VQRSQIVENLRSPVALDQFRRAVRAARYSPCTSTDACYNAGLPSNCTDFDGLDAVALANAYFQPAVGDLRTR